MTDLEGLDIFGVGKRQIVSLHAEKWNWQIGMCGQGRKIWDLCVKEDKKTAWVAA